jgi:hypothetical protein
LKGGTVTFEEMVQQFSERNPYIEEFGARPYDIAATRKKAPEIRRLLVFKSAAKREV